jgi:hypothetical protein
LQPIYRGSGRLRGTGFRAGSRKSGAAPKSEGFWAPWIDRPAFLRDFSHHLRRRYVEVSPGDEWSAWDLEISGLPFVKGRYTTAVDGQTVLRSRLQFGVTAWFWFLLAPLLGFSTLDNSDPVIALIVNGAILAVMALWVWRQVRLYRHLVAEAEGLAADDLGLIALHKAGAVVEERVERLPSEEGPGVENNRQ